MPTSSRPLRAFAPLLAALLFAIHAPHARAIELGDWWGSKASFEGLLQADAIWFDNDRTDLGGGSDDRATAMRRAELVLKGKGPGRFDWVVGYDARSERWLDVNGRYAFEAGTLQAGQYKQPNSLEELASTKNNDFISKAAATNTFAISRRAGVAWMQAGDRWTATGSVFGRDINGGGTQGSGAAVRATFAPVRTDARLFHLGASHARYDTDADLLRLRARPQADLASVRLVDTGTFADADRVAVTGVEALFATGPLKLQGEAFRADVQRLAHADFAGNGSYVSAVWNIGSSGWGYKGGVPTTPTPASGGSLWQLGLRHDRIDLDQGAVAGGEFAAWTAGINWYRGEHLKAMLNFVDVDGERAGASDDPDLVELRLQWHW